MNNEQIVEQQGHVRAWLRRAAKAEDAGEPLKGLTFREDNDEELDALQIFEMIDIDDVSDIITVSTKGRMFAGLIVADVPDLGVEKLAEMKGSVTETELAARFMESKVAGAERLAREDAHKAEGLRWLARCFQSAADEFRQGMHLPAVVIEGKVIPYNESNETGIHHAANLMLFFGDVHERNVRAGWWSDIETGEPKKRSPGELLILMVTEMAEAYDAWLTGEPDDKLPTMPGFGVELADLGIRWADFCGALMAGRIIQPNPAHNPGDRMFREIIDIARKYEAIRKTPQAVGQPETADFLPPQDVAAMTDAKLAFNATREDHKIENRLKADGKRT